jgi:hypothetical protein
MDGRATYASFPACPFHPCLALRPWHRGYRPCCSERHRQVHFGNRRQSIRPCHQSIRLDLVGRNRLVHRRVRHGLRIHRLLGHEVRQEGRRVCCTCCSALYDVLIRAESRGSSSSHSPFGMSLYGFPVILVPRTAVICFPWNSLYHQRDLSTQIVGTIRPTYRPLNQSLNLFAPSGSWHSTNACLQSPDISIASGVMHVRELTLEICR